MIFHRDTLIILLEINQNVINIQSFNDIENEKKRGWIRP